MLRAQDRPGRGSTTCRSGTPPVPAAPRRRHQVGHRVVGRGVVHHDDLEVRVVLAEHRGQAAVQPLGAVPGADDHAGRRRVPQRRRPADQVRRRPGQPQPAVAQRPRAVGRRGRGAVAAGCRRWPPALRGPATGRRAVLGIARGRAPACDLLLDGPPERPGHLARVGRAVAQRNVHDRERLGVPAGEHRADPWPGAVMPLTGSLSSTSQTFDRDGSSSGTASPAGRPGDAPGGTRPPQRSRRRTRPRPGRTRR